MNKAISFLKSIHLRQILTVFLAGVLVLFTTACNGAAQAKSPQGTSAPDGGPNPVGQTQPYQGGMNNFSDTAPGQAMKGTAEKTKSLIDRAEKDINTKGVDSVEQYVDNYRGGAPIQERTKNILDSAKEAGGNVKEDTKGVGDKLNKTSDRAADKTKEAGDRVQRGASNAKENTKQAGKGALDSAKNAVDTLKSKANDVAEDGSRALDDAGRSAKRAAKDAID